MPFLLFIAVFAISIVLSTFLILRQAKRFAQNPPTPLIDMDRMYDVIFEKLDEETGSKVTPKELDDILHSFVHVLSEHNLIKEKLSEINTNEASETRLQSVELTHKIQEHRPDIEVDESSIEMIIDLSFSYLQEINAIT